MFSEECFEIEKPAVVIHYGPYEANGVIRHKIQRLRGIMETFDDIGYDYTLEPSVHLNRLTIEMKNREVFRCDIRNLFFNMSSEGDQTCRKLIDAVTEASKRFNTSSNTANFKPRGEGTRNLPPKWILIFLAVLFLFDINKYLLAYAELEYLYISGHQTRFIRSKWACISCLNDRLTIKKKHRYLSNNMLQQEEKEEEQQYVFPRKRTIINSKTPSVIIYYGPYEAHGVVRHKTQRLRGVIDTLNNLGYEYKMRPSPHLNRVSVEMRDREIFRCDIRNLYFNMQYEDDPVCRKLIAAIVEAARRVCNSQNIMNYPSKSMGTKLVLLREKKSFDFTFEMSNQ